MKKIILVLFVIAANMLSAQDQLFKTDNTKLSVKILEVGPTEIKYKIFTNMNGPTYVERRDKVTLIIYENGTHEVISKAPSPPSETEMPTMPAREKDIVYQEPVRSTGYLKGDSALYYK